MTTAPTSDRLSVVVIAYDEEACIAPVVTELVRKLDRERIGFELILVDDGSRDGTLARMERLAAGDERIRVVPLSPNRGIGGALRAGFDAAQTSFVTWIPADGQIGPDVVAELFRQRNLAPMVTTVYVGRDDPWYRLVISATLNRIIWLTARRVARSGGNYIFRADLWRDHGPRDDDTMMLSTRFREKLRDAGIEIAEMPIHARARQAGQSKVLNPRTIGRTLMSTLRMRIGGDRR